jgi:hypothetical protein
VAILVDFVRGTEAGQGGAAAGQMTLAAQE